MDALYAVLAFLAAVGYVEWRLRRRRAPLPEIPLDEEPEVPLAEDLPFACPSCAHPYACLDLGIAPRAGLKLTVICRACGEGFTAHSADGRTMHTEHRPLREV